ncbi:MAG: rod shape-determining protein RodA [Chitinispirillales bacterium]|jgi:rod shape determining protein RodA|nr:rod shape-determining protein RodA [Chitinispirillales bacterium]
MIKQKAEKKSFDKMFFITAIFLWVIGNALVYSAVATQTSGPLVGIFKNQVIWTAMGIFIVFVMISVPTHWYYKITPVIYVATIILLIIVLVKGVSVKGAGRWLLIGGLKIQPSEFAKIGLLLVLARYFTKNEISLQNPISLVVPALLILVPFGLVVKQPDLSTTLALVSMSLPIFYWAGMTLIEIFYLVSPVLSTIFAILPLIVIFVQRGIPNSDLEVLADNVQNSYFGIICAIPWAIFFVLLCFVLYRFRLNKFLTIIVVSVNLFFASLATLIWENTLDQYQKVRVISFIKPQLDPKGSGYQVIQSVIAIGSGRILGKGYLEGTQVNLAYLPEQHTDFIFSVLGEQFGFIGCFFIILLFFLFVARALYSTRFVNDRFFNIIIVGAVSLLVYHIFVNIAMVIGLMPVTGLPLPFLSYGGSFTITVSILVGLILSANANNRNL